MPAEPELLLELDELLELEDELELDELLELEDELELDELLELEDELLELEEEPEGDVSGSLEAPQAASNIALAQASTG